MANANASRICHLLDIYDRHHGDEMNEEKGTRCNELNSKCLLRLWLDRRFEVRPWVSPDDG